MTSSNNIPTDEQIKSNRSCLGCMGIIFLFIVIFSVFSVLNNEKSNDIGFKSKKIYQSQFGDDWPFSVPEGMLECDGSTVTFIANKKIYAVNGLADAAGYEDIEEIWLDSKTPYQRKMDIGPIINEGLKLCGIK